VLISNEIKISGLELFRTLFIIILILILAGCNNKPDGQKVKDEVSGVEKSFEKMCEEKGIAIAFYFFADDGAVIKRQNDTLIVGKENIKKYYSNIFYKTASVKWSPDYIDVSEDGTLAYTYGKYVWKSKDKNGNESEFKGVFHTVWKKQKDNSWKYVWD
jgi:ketosteroid isomerase-like protein